MTLCRYRKIFASWQSGWILYLGHVNLYAWGEIWYPTIDWIPLDFLFKLQKSPKPRIRELYISGIDAYPFIGNADYGKSFCLPKRLLESEPWDFQLGEMEWAKENLNSK